jgi:hypothetical protein
MAIDDVALRETGKRRDVPKIGTIFPAVGDWHFDERALARFGRGVCQFEHRMRQRCHIGRKRVEMHGDRAVGRDDVPDSCDATVCDCVCDADCPRIYARINHRIQFEQQR